MNLNDPLTEDEQHIVDNSVPLQIYYVVDLVSGDLTVSIYPSKHNEAFKAFDNIYQANILSLKICLMNINEKNIRNNNLNPSDNDNVNRRVFTTVEAVTTIYAKSVMKHIYQTHNEYFI